MLNATGFYELEGHERKEVSTKDVDCGKCVTTVYFHGRSGEIVRRDVEIQVTDEAIRRGLALASKVHF